jgi:acyl dehydratase
MWLPKSKSPLLAGSDVPYFEDIELGDEIGPEETVATDEQVASFCEVWGPSKPNRFTDLKAASDSGMPGLIVPGTMALGLMARLLTNWAGPQALKDLDVVFRQPIPHNSPLSLAATVTDSRQEDGQNLIECDILMTGPEGERYVGGRAVVALESRP